MTEPAAALVLFSGGQDSTVCLVWALDRYSHVETVGFTYGQRHIVEIEARRDIRQEIPRLFPAWGDKLGPDHVLDLATLGQLSDTALTRDGAIEITAAGLPSTFVPGRNLLFLSYAAALGYRRGISTLVGGMCETDFSGYPDCRHETLQSLAHSLTLGMARTFTIETPLMWIDKAGTWALGERLGGPALTRLVVERSHTCYRGLRETLHAWGYGCGDCPACDLRRKGFERWATGRH